MAPSNVNGGDLVARVLDRHGVRFLFTLCGGHISPILVEAERRGIRIVDVRHEADAVFAADAVARLSGIPGVAAVTAGPGCTNTITAVKNAQLAHSPVVVLGGATATMLEGRGSLQDIDQRALFEPHVKWLGQARKVKELPELLTEAFRAAREGVPGPVFLECPVDLLYDRETVLSWYGGQGGKGLSGKAVDWYLKRHARKLFAGAGDVPIPPPAVPAVPEATRDQVEKVARRLARAERPVVVLGAQATLEADRADALARAVGELGVPVYLGSNARGLLGAGHPRQMRHKRSKALREADFVVLAGFPADFRMGYGRSIPKTATLVGVNRSEHDLTLNRKPNVAIEADPGRFLTALSRRLGEMPLAPGRWDGWIETLRRRDQERDAEIASRAMATPAPGGKVNPLSLCRHIERILPDDSVLVVDGGDFVATASYIVSPRGPLRWLDPGVFGTLGVGGGFALGAQLVRPEAEVWLLWGDGSAAFTLAEFDTFARHGLPVIAVVGNDAGWTQIAREQVEVLGAATGTQLARTDYHVVAEGYGGKGLLLERQEDIADVLAEAQAIASSGKPVLVNAHLATTDFRKGSISI
jgi:acetolactate synthase-like protein